MSRQAAPNPTSEAKKQPLGLSLLEAKKVVDYLKEVHGIEPVHVGAIAILAASRGNLKGVAAQIDPVAAISNCMLAPSRQLLGCMQAIINRCEQGAAMQIDAASSTLNPSIAELEASVLSWTQSPHSILQKLENPATVLEDQVIGVLFAEITEFASDELRRLLTILGQFIETHRFTADDQLVTAVGSALRKFAMNMVELSFSQYVEWLLPSQTDVVGHRAELELSKAFCWRLCLSPVVLPADYQLIQNALFDVCMAYMNRRVLLQKNFVSTTIHCIVAVVIIDALARQSHKSARLHELIAELNLDWFSALLQDQVGDAVAQIKVHSPEVADRFQQLTAQQSVQV